MRRRTRARIALAFSGLCVATLAAGFAVLWALHERAASVEPSPQGASSEAPALDAQGFPNVDWDYWRSVNPDVIGWITIPGTPVDYPVVQGPAEDPDFYLTHDVYRKPSYMGCIYLDAGCAETGLLDSRNAVLFGHHMGMGDTSMFNAVASYTDAAFAREHRRVLLQTPDRKRVFEVQASDCIDGRRADKRTAFDSDADFAQWYAERFSACGVKLAPDADVSGIVTLCTCSYNFWPDNERTIVYAAPLEETGAAHAE